MTIILRKCSIMHPQSSARIASSQGKEGNNVNTGAGQRIHITFEAGVG